MDLAMLLLFICPILKALSEMTLKELTHLVPVAKARVWVKAAAMVTLKETAEVGHLILGHHALKKAQVHDHEEEEATRANHHVEEEKTIEATDHHEATANIVTEAEMLGSHHISKGAQAEEESRLTKVVEVDPPKRVEDQEVKAEDHLRAIKQTRRLCLINRYSFILLNIKVFIISIINQIYVAQKKAT